MQNSSLKILHISDLHIENSPEKYKFHKDLLAYISENFKSKNIDFLIISGDLGNRCDYKNVKKATRWITSLKDSLKLNDDQIILCAGNHDIDTKRIKDWHYEKCLDFNNGNDYIKSKIYPKSAFNRFNKIEDLFQTKNKIKLKNKDILFETPNARFFILNSSWLSQITEKQRNDIITDFNLSANSQDLYTRVRHTFNGVLCVENFPDHPDIKNEVYKHSFNHSENTRQQIDKELYSYIEKELIQKNKLDDDKINVLIFHHPEFCLHFLEHFNMDGIKKSGSYYDFYKVADLLICGHIHPQITVKATDEYLKLPHLVGAACHKSSIENRPLFYYYEIDKDNSKKEFTCNRFVYVTDPKVTNNKFIELKHESLPIAINKEKRDENLTFSNPLIKSEKDLIKILENFQNLFSDLLFNFLKTVDGSTNLTEKSIWYPNKLKSPDYLISSRIFQIVIKEKICIIVDIFFCDILLFPDLLNCRIDKYCSLDTFNKNEKIISENIDSDDYIYIPLMIDPLYSLINTDKHKKKYFAKSRKLINDYFTNGNEFEKLAVFLERKVLSDVSSPKFPTVLNIDKDIYLSEKLINALLSGKKIDLYQLELDSENVILEYSGK